jgi:ubiquinone/menaquinone biosynthesis C-methylase UbiE
LVVGTNRPNCATRDAYDAVASDYARLLPDVSAEAPLDRAVLAAFVEMVQESGDSLVAEVGCGSGRVTAHLADVALGIIGLDLSLGMATVARSARPDLAFAVAHAGALPIRSGALGGLVAWYSLINLRTDLLPSILAEFARVTRSGAPIVVAFQSGEGERVDRTTAYGHPVPLTYYRHRIEDVADSLAGADFALHATVRREPMRAHETTPQAFLLAQRR